MQFTSDAYSTTQLKIVLKVSINCHRCQTSIMKAVARLNGIESLALDAEKSTLTVVGDVDVLRIGKELKKAGKAVEVVSVGPKREEKREEKEASETSEPLPPCCSTCRSHGSSHVVLAEELLPFGCNLL